MARSMIESAAIAQKRAQGKHIREVAAFLGVVTGTSDGKVTIRELGAANGATELYARLPGPALQNDDVVICIRVSGKTVVLGLAQNSEPDAYEFDVPLSVPALTINGTPIDPGALGGLTVAEGGTPLDTDITTLDFDASDFNLTESPENEVNIALNYGTSAGQPAEGDHDHDSDYADITHDHDADYADITHNHDSDYLAANPAFADLFPFTDTITTGSFNFRLAPSTGATIIGSATTGLDVHDTGIRHNAEAITWWYVWIETLGWGWITSTAIA